MTLALPAIERIMTVVAECLREMFPENFYKRCAYTASGTLSLLREAGAAGSLVGGDFSAFIVATAGNKAGLQGFGLGMDQCSHVWVEAEGRLIDVTPHFLPADASYPIVSMPGVAWDLARARPQALRYRQIRRFPGSTAFSADPAIQKRGEDFIQRRRERFRHRTIARFLHGSSRAPHRSILRRTRATHGRLEQSASRRLLRRVTSRSDQSGIGSDDPHSGF